MASTGWKRLFLSFEGRIGRRTFWIGFAAVMAASVAVNLLPVIGQIVGLILIWPQAAVHAKRLHDMGYTGWVQLLPLGVTLACLAATVIMGMSSQEPVVYLPVLVMFLVGLAFLAWVGFTRGEPLPNRFGPPPMQDTP